MFPFITAAGATYIAVVLGLRARRAAISRHPYRDPYGDAPGAWRSTPGTREIGEAIRSAPGTR